MQGRQAIWTVNVQLHNWVPSSYQTSWNSLGNADPAVNQPLCKWGKNSWERNSWANVSWKNSSIVWACDIVGDHKVINPVLHGFGLTSPKPCKGMVIDVRGFGHLCYRYLGPSGQQAFRWHVWARKRLRCLFLPCQSLMCAICPLWHKLIPWQKN